MKLAFYPGCALEGMANDYARSIEAVFRHLGIELIEIDDWSCCGATAAHSLDEAMTVALPARNLAAAENLGLDIVAPCANCFNRLLFYDGGAVFHGSDIAAPERLSDDPSRGRLTWNGFFVCRRTSR